MLIIGRVLLGGGIGFGNQVVPLYLSEMALARIRVAVNQLFQFTTCFGILVANLINYFTDEIHPHGRRILLGLSAIPGLLMLVGSIFCAEIPNSLVEQGRFDEARKVLEKIATAVALALNFGHGKELSKSVSYFLIIVIFLFVLAYGRSWGPLGWLVPRELFPLKIRSVAQSIVVCVNTIFTALVA
ncbi:sugar transport protein 14-like [Arachis hypogaea]|uniref:sugar transport protein 14-like n=1 Tax=Arachis hypogaea TaxID=3818 RepID=UPI003B227EA2